jgi:hypothetical protein
MLELHPPGFQIEKFPQRASSNSLQIFGVTFQLIPVNEANERARAQL